MSCEFDPSFTIDEASSFSALYMGPLHSVPGVSTVLHRMQSKDVSGWLKIKEWKTQESGATMFSSGDGFDYAKGR